MNIQKIGVALACTLSALTGADGLDIQVNGATPTQAILSYTAPDNNPCSVAVSASSGLSPLVNDVNPALFPEADSDARRGDVVSGTSRTVVVGRRTAERALDGNHYSRALQASTQHYFTVTCGSSSGSGTFTTTNPQPGDSAPEVVPFLSGAWGNQGWPSMSWASQSASYIDPLTGLLIKRITGPGQSIGSLPPAFTARYVTDLASAWTTPSNILGSSGYASTAAQGVGNALFIPMTLGFAPGPGFQAWTSTDDVQTHFTGYASASGGAVSVCLTLNGATCTGTPIVVTLPTASGNVSAPSSGFPNPLFNAWGQLKLTSEQMNNQSGAATINGTALTLTAADGRAGYTTYFPLNLASGARILVSGSSATCPNNVCTIASETDASHLVLNQNLGSWSGFSTTLSATISAGATSFGVASASGFIRSVLIDQYMTISFADSNPESVNCAVLSGTTFSSCGATTYTHSSGAAITQQVVALENWGYLVWNSGSAATVYLQASTYSLAVSDSFYVGYDGSENFCSVSTVTVNYAADGVTLLSTPETGRICQFLDAYNNPALYLFIPATGESRLIDYGEWYMGGGTTGTFDPSDPDTVYYAQNNSANPNVYKVTYNASVGHYAALPPNYTGSTCYGGTVPNCSVTNITSGTGNDLMSQVAKVVPGFNSAYFSRVSGFSTLMGNYIGLTIQAGGQNSLAYSCFFDVTQAAGSQVVACHDSWSTYPERWGGAHSPFTIYTSAGWGGIILTALSGAGQTGLGVYQLAVNSIAGESGTTALTANVASDPTTQNCSTLGVTDPRWIALGATGNNCIQMVVASEPQNIAPSAADKAQWPSACNSSYAQLQSIQPGDYVYDPANGSPYGENFLVAGKSGSGCSPITLVLARGVNQACAVAPQAHANGWMPVMAATANCSGNVYWFQASNPGTAYVDNSAAFLAHTTTAQADGTGTNLVNYQAYVAAFNYNSYGVRQGALPGLIGQPDTYGVKMTYPFAGSTAGVGIGYIQTHPGGQSYLATPNTLGYDGRPLGGAGGGVAAVWYHTITGPVTGTSQVYQISCALSAPNGSCIETLDRKKLQMAAFAGRFLLADISGPGSVIADSNPYTYCIADFAGECRPGSSQGDRFINVPQIDTSGVCIIGALDRNTPCLATAPAEIGEALQFDWGASDPNGISWRRLGYALGGPGQTNNFWNVHGIVDASWAFTEMDWKEGVRKDIVAIQLPPWPGTPTDGIDRSDFVQLAIPITGGAGDSVRIRFGYNTNLYCTSRLDPCTTEGAAPFTWLSEAGGTAKAMASGRPIREPAGMACPTTCVVNIPALSSRVLYYVVDYITDHGVISTAMQAVAVP